MDKLKEQRGYCKLKEEGLDCILWGNGFGRGYRPVIRTGLEINTLIN
jgi:hypothetical protein